MDSIIDQMSIIVEVCANKPIFKINKAAKYAGPKELTIILYL